MQHRKIEKDRQSDMEYIGTFPNKKLDDLI